MQHLAFDQAQASILQHAVPWSSNSLCASGKNCRSDPNPSDSRAFKLQTVTSNHSTLQLATTLHSAAQSSAHSTPCSAFAPLRAPRKRSPLSATLPLAAGLPPARSSRAPPTTLSTARGPLLSSTLLTLLVSRLEREEGKGSAGWREEGSFAGGKRHWDSGRRARSEKKARVEREIMKIWVLRGRTQPRSSRPNTFANHWTLCRHLAQAFHLVRAAWKQDPTRVSTAGQLTAATAS